MFEDAYDGAVEDNSHATATESHGTVVTTTTSWPAGVNPSIQVSTTIAPSIWATRLSSVLQSTTVPTEGVQETQRPASYTAQVTEAPEKLTTWVQVIIVIGVCIVKVNSSTKVYVGKM